MKKLFLFTAFVFLLAFTAAQAKPANPPAGFGIFFSVLGPHGSWIELDDGLVVWRPTIMRRGWAPYSDGRWIWTSDGWYWDSYEPFGYVVYHYGRWYYDDYYGWIWVPDYDWAPSWVEWRYDDEYIGWAPLPPYAIFSVNIGIHYTYNYYTPYTCWHFTTYRYFDDPYVYRHFVGARYRHNIFERTKYRTNYDYYDGRVVNRGVDVDFVRQRSGREIRTRDIERIRDYSQFSGNRDRGTRDDRIRTLYVPREELRNENDFDRKEIKRSDRKTSLDIAKVEIGDRRDMKRDDRTREVVTSDEKKNFEKRDSDIRDSRDMRSRNDENNFREKKEVRIEERRGENPGFNRNRNDELEKSRIQEKQQNQDRRNEEIMKQRDEQIQRKKDAEIRNRNEERIKVEKRNNDTRIRENVNNDRREVKRTETRYEERRNDTRVERNDNADRNKNGRGKNR